VTINPNLGRRGLALSARGLALSARGLALSASESSAFFFFALPLQDGADADAHGALFTQRWLFEAVFITARPQEQAGACGRALEVALAEIAIEAL